MPGLTPSIVVEKAGTASATVPTVVHSNADRPLTPKINTTPFPSKDPSQKSCYLCDEQNPGDFSPTTKYLEQCLLCARPYCPVHKAVQHENVCNINHSKYYHERLERTRDELASKSPDGTARRVDAEEVVMREGVFPSLGERQKAIFRNSPVSPGEYIGIIVPIPTLLIRETEKLKEIANFRSLDAELSGTQGKGASTLIEERDAHDADVAF